MADSTYQTIVICYDIERARTRRKIAKLLEGRMVRVQQSVFEARLHNKAAERLFDQASANLDDGDSLRMYVLSKTGLRNSRVFGGAPLPEESGFWLI